MRFGEGTAEKYIFCTISKMGIKIRKRGMRYWLRHWQNSTSSFNVRILRAIPHQQTDLTSKLHYFDSSWTSHATSCATARHAKMFQKDFL